MTIESPLPANWAEVPFREIYELHYGKALPERERDTEGKIPVLGSSGVVGHHSEFMVAGPAIIVGRKGAAGAVIFVGEDFWPIDTTYFVKPPPGILPKYAYYHLKALQLHRLEKSTAVPGLSRDDAYALNIALPPTDEQRRIVAKIEELFSELDKGVESLTAAREQLKAYRQSVLKAAFEGKLTAHWREHNNERLTSANQLRSRLAIERQAHYEKVLSEGGRRSRALEAITPVSPEIFETLPSLPTSWAWEKLGWMTCGVEYGTAAKSSKAGEVPVIRMGNLQSGRIDWDDLVYTDDPEEIARYQLRPGDVLFNRTNSPELVGKSSIYRGERPALFAGYLIRVNHNPAVVDGQYLTYFLNSHVARQYGNSVKTDGVNQSNINGEKLQGYPFPFCSLDEQREVVRILDEKLSATDGVLDEIEHQLARCNALRQSILKKAFSGQLLPQDTSDEPASVLLERIRAEREDCGNGRKKSNKNGKKEAA